MSEDFRQFVNTPMNERQFEALEYIKRHEEISNNVDVIRRAVIFLAKSLGWQDPLEQPTTPLKRKA